MNNSRKTIIGMLIMLGLSVLLFTSSNADAGKKAAAAMHEGEKLERQMWADIKAKDWKAVESKLAMGFQSVYVDGVRDRRTEVELLKGLNVGRLELSDFMATENWPAIVVSYKISVEETIDGKRISVKGAPRQSTWLRTDKGWQWMAHANLNP